MSDLTRSEKYLREALRAATQGSKRGIASPCNYSVWDGTSELETGLSHDEAIGFARGLTYAGYVHTPTVRCGVFVVWPEDRYGELIMEEEP